MNGGLIGSDDQVMAVLRAEFRKFVSDTGRCTGDDCKGLCSFWHGILQFMLRRLPATVGDK
jgi:hypothetical protein